MYMFYMYRRVIFGTITRDDLRGMLDLSPREKAIFAPLLLLVLWMGVYPNSFLLPIRASVDNVVQRASAAAKAAQQESLPDGGAAISQVVSAKAAIPGQTLDLMPWTPAFAGTKKMD